MSANYVFLHTTSISLEWGAVSGATQYHVQVGLTPDFTGTLIENDSGVLAASVTYADNAVNDAKRYWRWRYSTDSGTTWSAWGSVGSYWLNTSATSDVLYTTSHWGMFNPDAPTDIFTFDDFPAYKVVDQNLYRVKARNRQGELLSEYLTNKAMITLDFPDSIFMTHKQMREFNRFNTEIKTFFLAAFKTNGTEYVPHIWKVQFSADPDMTMLAAGREDYFTGTLNFEEV